jgi:hypothetical protein
MPGSARSSTINGESDIDYQPREKSVDQGIAGTNDKKQSLLGVDSEDLKATGQQPGKAVRTDGKVELTEDEAYDKLGYTLPEWRKWSILVLILLIQTSMNSNASMYGAAVEGIAEEFEVSETKARLGQALFLIFYAFGCELWAPWSEELGRWPTREFQSDWKLTMGLMVTFRTTVSLPRQHLATPLCSGAKLWLHPRRPLSGRSINCWWLCHTRCDC